MRPARALVRIVTRAGQHRFGSKRSAFPIVTIGAFQRPFAPHHASNGGQHRLLTELARPLLWAPAWFVLGGARSCAATPEIRNRRNILWHSSDGIRRAS